MEKIINSMSDGQFSIEEMKLEDIEAATIMRLQSWLDTYVNNDMGVTKEWIVERNSVQLSEDKMLARKQRFLEGKQKGTFAGWVAKSKDGEIIGSTTPFIDGDGTQHVGSLYVDKKWHGKGVAQQLMQKVLDWLDTDKSIELGVVTYNERAKAFYRNWGFEEVPNTEVLIDDKLPDVRMIRRGNDNV